MILYVLAILAMEPPPQNSPTQDRAAARFVTDAVDAGRTLLQAAQRDGRITPDDLHNAEAQFALMLISAGNCADGITFLDGHQGVRAGQIQRLILSPKSDRACKTALARLMLARSSDDPQFLPAGRSANRFEAAAYLDAAGDPTAPAAMRAAEAELKDLRDMITLWNVRGRSIAAYPPGPARSRYLEQIADQMVLEGLMAGRREWNSLVIAFAHNGRCDLIQKVTRQGPESCSEPQASADQIYGKPAANEAEMRRFADNISRPGQSPETVPLGDEAIAFALAAPDLWWRMTRLLTLVQRARRESGAVTSGR